MGLGSWWEAVPNRTVGVPTSVPCSTDPVPTSTGRSRTLPDVCPLPLPTKSQTCFTVGPVRITKCQSASAGVVKHARSSGRAHAEALEDTRLDGAPIRSRRSAGQSLGRRLACDGIRIDLRSSLRWPSVRVTVTEGEGSYRTLRSIGRPSTRRPPRCKRYGLAERPLDGHLQSLSVGQVRSISRRTLRLGQASGSQHPPPSRISGAPISSLACHPRSTPDFRSSWDTRRRCRVGERRGCLAVNNSMAMQ